VSPRGREPPCTYCPARMAGLFFPTNRRDRGRQLRRPRSVIAKIVQRQFAKLVGIAHARVSKLDNLVRYSFRDWISCIYSDGRAAGASARPCLREWLLLLDPETLAQVEGTRRRTADSPQASPLRRSPLRPPNECAARTPDGGFGSISEVHFNRNGPQSSRFATRNIGTSKKVKRVMDSDADRFRQYAAECRRLAQRASEKDKAILMEIAGAWIACAEEAQRKAQSATKNT
jgi:hypothetical protein